MSKRLSDVIIDSGEDFQVDVMGDYEERVNSGEFAGKSTEEIRTIYLNEAIAMEEDQDMHDQIREMEEQEESEYNRD